MKLSKNEKQEFIYSQSEFTVKVETLSRNVITNPFDNKTYCYRFNIKLTNTKTGQSCMFHYHTSINDYQNNVKTISNLGFALYCFASDAISYGEAWDLTDFMNEFGYMDRKEGKRVYDACKVALSKLESIGLTQDDLYTISGDERLQ